MKIAFLISCTLCAICVGLLIAIMQTGRIPFRHPLPPKPALDVQDPAATAQLREGKQITDKERVTVQDLIKSLTAEREAVIAMKAELAAKQEGASLKEAAFASAKKDIELVQEGIKQDIELIEERNKANITEIAATEQINFKHLADVYTKMEPLAASQLMKQLNVTNAATILNMIPERSAAGIMNAAIEENPDNAAVVARWSDIIKRIKADKKNNVTKK